MKIFHFETPHGNVDMKVDILDSNNGSNATIMEINYNVTDSDLIVANDPATTILNFQNVYPVFAGIQQLVSSLGTLVGVAQTNNFTLIQYDQESNPVTLNTSTTTTTTTAAPTTTTTTTVV